MHLTNYIWHIFNDNNWIKAKCKNVRVPKNFLFPQLWVTWPHPSKALCRRVFCLTKTTSLTPCTRNNTTALNKGPPVNPEFNSNRLTDIEGIKYVAGALGVVAPTPEVDDVIQEHSCVAISHVWHLTGSSVSSCPHRRQLHPAQRHWRRKQATLWWYDMIDGWMIQRKSLKKKILIDSNKIETTR